MALDKLIFSNQSFNKLKKSKIKKFEREKKNVQFSKEKKMFFKTFYFFLANFGVGLANIFFCSTGGG